MSIRSFIRVSVLISLGLCFIQHNNEIFASDFERLERGHFVVYHHNIDFANRLSWKAEYYYKKILNHFGVREFRPWEGGDKCPIYVYKTREDFMKGTGAAEWAGGAAQYEPFGFASYEGSSALLTSTLPHEMTHMLLYLFMDKKPPPLWLNEGMAQFEEEEQTIIYNRKRFMKFYAKEGSYIELNELMAMTGIPKDEEAIFYAEASSIVDHLITDNIRTNYGRFLTYIKNGYRLEDALKKAYQWKYKNGIADLEKRWLEFLKRKY